MCGLAYCVLASSSMTSCKTPSSSSKSAEDRIFWEIIRDYLSSIIFVSSDPSYRQLFLKFYLFSELIDFSKVLSFSWAYYKIDKFSSREF